MANLGGKLHSAEYLQACKKIRSWKNRLKNATPEEALRVGEEKLLFFTEMRRTSSSIYSLFQIDDKIIGELVLGRVLGKPITMD